MSKLKRKNLNNKITSTVTLLQNLNNILKDVDVTLFEYYEELKKNFTIIFNEIVENYIYKRPSDDLQIIHLKSDFEELMKENDFLKSKLEKIITNSKFKKFKYDYQPEFKWKKTVDLKKNLKSTLIEIKTTTEKKDEIDLKKKDTKYGNNLLRWNKTKDFNKKIPTLTYHSFTKVQLSSFLEEIYAKKKIYDKNCLQKEEGIETVEQFVFYHLKKKYRLNSVVIERVFGLIEGIRVFSPKDAEIALFGLIMRNEIDEDFRDIVLQIKFSVRDLLYKILENGNNYMGKKDLVKLWNKKIKGDIKFDKASEIIEIMFEELEDENEVINLIEKLRKEIVVQKQIKKSYTAQKSVELIPFRKLEKSILCYHIRKRHNYLSNLKNQFIKKDRKRYGYINRDKFCEITDIYDPEIKIDRDDLVEKVDPFDNNAITFDSMVKQFMIEKVENEENGESLNLIQISNL